MPQLDRCPLCEVMSFCNVCCKEFKGWCRAFTATEVILSIVQAILLTLFIAFLTFLLLHFIACLGNKTSTLQPHVFTPATLDPAVDWPTTNKEPIVPNKSSDPDIVSYISLIDNDLTTPDIACTWTSAKSHVVTEYFEQAKKPFNASDASKIHQMLLPFNKEAEHNEDIFVSDHLDGVPAYNKKTFIMALVKMRPPDDITFGCILSIISEFWTLTAASCIESIEEIDSLDSFVMIENFGESRHGRSHIVSDVLIHPQYQGRNISYDIVALKSEDELTNRGMLPKLPTLLDYLLVTIGERLTILGFGKFRSINRDAFARGAHAVAVHVLPGAECGARGGAWSARHLAGGERAARGRCGAAALCAAPLRARSSPCNYCAGTPLLQGGVLLGLMSESAPCGAPCEPVLYVNLAASLDWLNSIVGTD